jgi:phosphomevalonate kinase
MRKCRSDATVIARAPGKAFLCGEYAVLAGAPAVVVAVCRYAQARAVSHAVTESAFVREATRRASEHVETRVPPWVAVNTDGFFAQGGEKLGLGSSAAATVATAGLVFAAAGRDLSAPEVRRELHAVAAQAHSSVQAGEGSGADISASVYGGVIRFVKGEEPHPLDLPRRLELVFVWTGRAASTKLWIASIRKAGLPLGDLPSLASTFAEAFAKGDVRATIETARLYGAALQKLGERCGVPIVTREHALLAELAHRQGGAAKPSGAGGGDIGVAFLQGPEAAAALRADAARAGLAVLDLPLDGEGVHQELEA